MQHRTPALACLLTSLALAGCGQTVVVDRFYRSDGTQLWVQPWYRGAGGARTPHGTSRFWYRSGGRKDHITHREGRPHGAWTHWYENGPRAFSCTFKDGALDGPVTIWDARGRKVCGGRYKAGLAWDGSFYRPAGPGAGPPALSGSVMHCRGGRVERTTDLASLDTETRAALLLYASRRAPTNNY